MLDSPLPPQVEKFLRLTGHDRDVTDPRQIKVLPGDFYVMAYPLMFHWTVITGYLLDYWGYADRWCFATRGLALDAIEAWPVEGWEKHEPAGWHRHPNTGRRRPDGDPSAEYIEW